jgi:uncharacterized OsmC-like protein
MQQQSKTGTVRVDLELSENKTFDAVFKSEEAAFEFLIDEPSVRGGDSHGPTPLGYFVAGAASCLAMQYAGLIKEQAIAITGLKMLARAHHDRERRVFKDMIYRVDLTGSISADEATALAEAASKRCFVENTITQVIPITTDVHLNGEKVTTIARLPHTG